MLVLDVLIVWCFFGYCWRFCFKEVCVVGLGFVKFFFCSQICLFLFFNFVCKIKEKVIYCIVVDYDFYVDWDF